MALIRKQLKDTTSTHGRMSDYKGVRWNKNCSMWHSSFTHKGITYDCGFFANDKDAAKSRDIKIISLGLKLPLQILKPTKTK